MRVLGLSALFHDAAAALVDHGRIVAAAEEERFSRIKHDSDLPVQAAAFCLRHAGLTAGDLDALVFYEKPLRKFERLLVQHLRSFPRGLGQFHRSLSTWLGDRLWLEGRLADTFGVARDRVLFCDHHLAHAASAFLCSPFDRAAVIVVDGVGEWATTTIYRAQGTTIEPLRELHFPHSIGLLYSAITAYLGFEVNEGEYKVMGLAAFGEPRFEAEMARLAHVGEDGALTLDLRYFAFHRDPDRSFTPALCELLGPARAPEGALRMPPVTADEQRWADVAASLQRFTESYLLTLAREAHALTGAPNLCLAGGVALNSVANRRVQAEGPFDEVFVQPAAGDAGGSLGAALWATHVVGGLPRVATMDDPFLGEAYTPGEVARFLSEAGIPARTFDDVATRDEMIAARLARGHVGGLFQGRFEWGPRALGARSILADPRDPRVKDRVNRCVKFREPFRPFAPAVLAEEISRWFDVLPQARDHLSPFMCTVAPVNDAGRRTLPAITHVDGTARVQRVDAERNAPFYRVIDAFRRHTGVGVLLNTSMNLKGEPLVASPADAYAVFARSELDFLVLERSLVERPS